MMDQLKTVWMSGGHAAVRRDGSPKVAFQAETLERLWRAFEASGQYLFNASHAYAYAALSWQTAYLKANWPAQFGAALLANTDRSRQVKRQKVLADLVAEGLEVRPPSVQTGWPGTSASADGAVVLGLSEIRGVGEAGAKLVAEREANGPFVSLSDLVSRTGLSSTAVQALAEAGALDEFGPRMGIVMACRVAKVPAVAIPDVEWGILERSARQRSRLGLQLGDHPITVLADKIRSSDQVLDRKRELANELRLTTPDFRQAVHIPQLHNVPRRNFARVDTVAVVAQAAEADGARGRRLVLQVDSPLSSCEVMMWPDDYAKHRARGGLAPQVGQLVGITGSVRMQVPVSDDSDDGDEAEPVLSLVANRLWPIHVDDRPAALSAAPGTICTLGLEPEPAPAQTFLAAREAVRVPQPTLLAPKVPIPAPGGLADQLLADMPTEVLTCYVQVRLGRELAGELAQFAELEEIDPAQCRGALGWFAAAVDGDKYMLSLERALVLVQLEAIASDSRQARTLPEPVKARLRQVRAAKRVA